MCILAETEEIKAILQKEGVDVETVEDVYPIRVQPARILSHIYARLGELAALLLQQKGCRRVCPPLILLLIDTHVLLSAWLLLPISRPEGQGEQGGRQCCDSGRDRVLAAVAQSLQEQTEALIPIGGTWCGQELSSVPVLRSGWGKLARPQEGSSGCP